MWNEKTKQLVADEKLVVIGVVQEQHAERAQLYKQWKQYEFPIAQDSITGLGLTVVPVPVLIDEYGYVMTSRLRPDGIEKLVAQETSEPASSAPVLIPEHVTSKWLHENSPHNPTAKDYINVGDALLRVNTSGFVALAVASYEKAVAAAAKEDGSTLAGLANFRLGVAYRTLYDVTEEKDPANFTKAAKHWSAALEANPNQYIWRRRIQQYGPRQMKPYPFYDWVESAQQEITARGETPIKLAVPLSGAEIAQPNRKFETLTSAETDPDPENKIDQDDEGLIEFHATVVPSKVVAGSSVRVHLRFTADKGHWNNEAEEMVVWIRESKTGTSSKTRLTHANAKEASSDEPRSLEFEFQTNKDLSGQAELKAYVLYYVCKSEDGQCLYRRKDITIPIEIEPKK